MRVWLVTVGEPLPVDVNPRLLRAGLLAEMLAARGHDVIWWTSTFDHFTKRQRFTETTRKLVGLKLEIVLLYGPGYRNNVSLRRIWNHGLLARSFSRAAKVEPKPDVILCSYPTIELSAIVARYGKENGIPSVLDIRDLWPDIFLELVPRLVRPFGRLVLSPWFRMSSQALREASTIIAINPDFVKWGVERGHRTRSQYDKVFPLAYRSESPPHDVIASAHEWWRKRGVTEDDFIACFFGTFGRQFEIEIVIEAARKLTEAGLRVKFLMCGEGESLPRYKALARDCPNVIFPGWVGRPEIWTLMRMASVGLAPYTSGASFTSSLPNKAIEYLSAGLPVLSSLRGALEELIVHSKCGLTYENGDVDACAAAIRSLHDRPDLLRTMRSNAKAVFQERFVAEIVYNQLVEYLDCVRTAYVAGEFRQSSLERCQTIESST